MVSRRDMIVGGATALAGGALLAGARRAAGQDAHGHHHEHVEHADHADHAAAPSTAPAATQAAAPDASGEPLPPGEPGRDYTPVIVPDGWTLPYTLVGGVKVFHLVAEEVLGHEFVPGLVADCWGYNGSVHGPAIEAVEGDRVRIFVTNRLPAPTSVHWHGILLPSGMDGVAGVSHRAIAPGETFAYEFTLRQHGTHFYHPHHDEMTQMAMGMMGLLIIHPRRPEGPRPDRDYAYMLSEWRIDAGVRRPDPNEMLDFNQLTLNARAFPATEPMLAALGERVRIRLANGSATNHHPIHLHGYRFMVTQTDGGEIAPSARWPETTVVVPVGSTRTVEFVADAPGDWAFHCHMTHHTMNQMGHAFPNMIGVEASAFERRMRRLVPGFMTMGQTGMGDMGEHVAMGHMPVPANSIPMVGGDGPHGYIVMGGMFTILKVRERLDGRAEAGWYNAPPGTTAGPADGAELRRLGIAPDGSTAPRRPSAGGGPDPVEPTVPPGPVHDGGGHQHHH